VQRPSRIVFRPEPTAARSSVRHPADLHRLGDRYVNLTMAPSAGRRIVTSGPTNAGRAEIRRVGEWRRKETAMDEELTSTSEAWDWEIEAAAEDDLWVAAHPTGSVSAFEMCD
jgi:hypothetical protein